MRGIALAGPKGSGKSTFAAAITREVSGRAFRLSFAEPIYDIARRLGYEKGDLGCREKCLEIGERERRFDPHVWIKALEVRIANLPEGAVFVVDDLRKPTERDWARSNGVPVVYVDVPEAVRSSRLGSLDTILCGNEMRESDADVVVRAWSLAGDDPLPVAGMLTGLVEAVSRPNADVRSGSRASGEGLR